MSVMFNWLFPVLNSSHSKFDFDLDNFDIYIYIHCRVTDLS